MSTGLPRLQNRPEEKLLREALADTGIEPVMIESRKLVVEFRRAPGPVIISRRNPAPAARRSAART